MQDNTGMTTYTYDNAGQLRGYTNGIGKRLTHSYDPAGNRVSTLDYDGMLTTYAYDTLNRLSGIVNKYNQVTTIAYDRVDREVTKIMGNGMVHTMVYDAANNQTSRSYVNAAGTLIALYTATYDNVRNRLSMVELDSSIVTYSYDAINQLVNENRSGTQPFYTTYGYDPTGNRIQRLDNGVLTTYSYNTANEQLQYLKSGSGLKVWQYDQNGNTTVEDPGPNAATYLYDPENHYIGNNLSDGGFLQVPTDAIGHRQKITNLNGTTYLIWDEENIISRLDTSYVANFLYTQYPRDWGGLISMRSFGTDYYYGFDMSGNTRLLVNNAGTVTDSLVYQAFGEKLVALGSTSNIFGFGGQYGIVDDTANAYYMRMRMLLSKRGNFMQRDPIGDLGGDWNFYCYVKNNSINNIDPNGLSCQFEAAIATLHPTNIFQCNDADNQCCRNVCNGRIGVTKDAILDYCYYSDSGCDCDGNSSKTCQCVCRGKLCNDPGVCERKNGCIYPPNWPWNSPQDAAQALASVPQGTLYNCREIEDGIYQNPCGDVRGIGKHYSWCCYLNGKKYRVGSIYCCPSCKNMSPGYSVKSHTCNRTTPDITRFQILGKCNEIKGW